MNSKDDSIKSSVALTIGDADELLKDYHNQNVLSESASQNLNPRDKKPEGDLYIHNTLIQPSFTLPNQRMIEDSTLPLSNTQDMGDVTNVTKNEINSLKNDFEKKVNLKDFKHAYITLVSEDCCGPFALVVSSSLRQLNVNAARVALISDKISDSAKIFLEDSFDQVVEIRREFFVNEGEIISDSCWESLMKAYSWTLTQFEKCVFLDVDSLVMMNIDELFAYDELSAAASYGWPDFFNTGVFVFKPSKVTYEKMVTFILEFKNSEETEESIFNQFFSGWAKPENSSKHLQHLYNVHADSNPRALLKYQDNVRVFRCSGALKSWMDDEDKSLEDLTSTRCISLPSTPHQPFLHKWLTLLFENECAIQWALSEVNDSEVGDIIPEDTVEMEEEKLLPSPSWKALLDQNQNFETIPGSNEENFQVS